MKQKHILVVSQYFYPEQFRINDICREWVERGYRVTVLTGIPNYPQGRFYPEYGLFKKRKEKYDGVDIIRIPLVPRGNKSIMLALNYLSFVISGFFWSLFTRLKADFVYIYEVSPMTQALPGVWYSKRKKVPCYLYVMDPWPENVQIMTGISHPVVIKPLAKMVEYIYRHCSKIFISSPRFMESLKQRQVAEEQVEYWPQYAEDFYEQVDRQQVTRTEIPQDGVLNITFAGNIGQAQGLDILPKAAKALKEEGVLVRFNLIGDGRYKKALMDEVKSQQLEAYFNFIDKQPATEIPAFLSLSDVSLITLSKSEVFAMTLPAKVQSCMACGTPLLVSADGAIQEVVKDSKGGLSSNAQDVDGLVKNILAFRSYSQEELREMGQQVINYSREHFNKETLMNRMDSYFS